MDHKTVAPILWAFALLAYIVEVESGNYDITQYGAKSGGDISEALQKAWKEACACTSGSKVVIPKGTWKLGQIELLGPNKAPIGLCIQGTVEATGNLPISECAWITIRNVNDIDISGGGVFDGKGQEDWKKNDCVKNSKCKPLSNNLGFFSITNMHFHDMTSKDSKGFHMNLIDGKNVTFEKVTISAPEDSPNTDGMHLARSQNVNVLDTIIQTGDDCISIGDDSQEFNITKVTCGPGHGISIGSLGKYPEEKDVTGIYVSNCTLKGTTNGVRIKTWPSSPVKTRVSKLVFENLVMDNVQNPIIIDQEYCPNNQCSVNSDSLIEISDVTIKNVKGTSSLEDAVVLACSKTAPCKNVNIADIDLKSTCGSPATSKCSNVEPIVGGQTTPTICEAAVATKIKISEL